MRVLFLPLFPLLPSAFSVRLGIFIFFFKTFCVLVQEVFVKKVFNLFPELVQIDFTPYPDKKDVDSAEDDYESYCFVRVHFYLLSVVKNMKRVYTILSFILVFAILLSCLSVVSFAAVTGAAATAAVFVDYFVAAGIGWGVGALLDYAIDEVTGGDSACSHHFVLHRGGFGGDASGHTTSSPAYYYCDKCGAVLPYSTDRTSNAYNSYVSNMETQSVFSGDCLDLSFQVDDSTISLYERRQQNRYISGLGYGINKFEYTITDYLQYYTQQGYSWPINSFNMYTSTFTVPSGTFYYSIDPTISRGYRYSGILLQHFTNGEWVTVSSHYCQARDYSSSSDGLVTVYQTFPFVSNNFSLDSSGLYRFCLKVDPKDPSGGVTSDRLYDCYLNFLAGNVKLISVEDTSFVPETSNIDRPSYAQINYAYYDNSDNYQYSPSTYVVNEGDNYYYNPVTNSYYDMSNWSYDYSTRTYYLNTVDDHSVSVTYGDEYLIINEGDTVYNLYYTVDVPDNSSCVHNYVLSSSVEPTCETPGRSFYICSLCGSSFESPISPLGHIWDWVETVEQEPGSNEAGDEGDELEPPPAVVESEPETEDPAGDQPRAGEGEVDSGPIIITQQVVDAFANKGDKFTFFFEAIGNELIFRWFYSDDFGETWTASSLSSNCITFTLNTPKSYDRIFRCKITDVDGNTIFTDYFRAFPFIPLEIIGSPSSISVIDGSAAEFSVDVVGSYPSFLWECCRSDADVWSSVNYPGFDSAILSVPASMDLDGASFRCVVTNSKGETLVSDAAVLSVLPSETPDPPADDGDLQPQLFDLYRCRRCGETRLVRVGDSPVSFYSGSGLSSSWLDEFRRSLYERLDAILDETKRDYNYKLDEILNALKSGSFLDTLFDGVSALSSLFDIPSLDDLLGVSGDILDGVTDSLPDIDFDLTDVQGAGASGSIAGILAAFAWWRTVWDIGTMFVETVSANEQAAYAYDAESPGSNPPGAPSIPLDLSAAHSYFGYDYGGQVEMIDLSWYTPYKETVDHIISGFLWLSFLWALFRHAPGIISGAGLTHSRMDDLTEGKRGRK